MNDLHTAAAYQAMDRQSGSVLVGGNKIAQAPERDLRHIITRIDEAAGSAGLCAERVHDIADRVKGSVPSVGGEAKSASGGMGDIAEIHSLLDALFNNLARTADGIGRLDRL